MAVHVVRREREGVAHGRGERVSLQAGEELLHLRGPPGHNVVVGHVTAAGELYSMAADLRITASQDLKSRPQPKSAEAAQMWVTTNVQGDAFANFHPVLLIMCGL